MPAHYGLRPHDGERVASLLMLISRLHIWKATSHCWYLLARQSESLQTPINLAFVSEFRAEMQWTLI